jgi:CheY-like chemotaxis protein
MTEPRSALIVFLTGDLVFPSRIAPVAQRLGAQFVTAGNAEMLLTKIDSATVDRVIVLLDLNSPAVDPDAIVPQLKTRPKPPTSIIAFGPHVHAAKLAAAEAAGCDLVLTRGQFDAQIESLLAELIGQE